MLIILLIQALRNVYLFVNFSLITTKEYVIHVIILNAKNVRIHLLLALLATITYIYTKINAILIMNITYIFLLKNIILSQHLAIPINMLVLFQHALIAIVNVLLVYKIISALAVLMECNQIQLINYVVQVVSI